MISVRLICDGGREFGYGHLSRSSTLAETLRQRGHHVSISPISEDAKRLLSSTSEPAFSADVWVLDLPYSGDEWISHARDVKARVVALDFIGTGAPGVSIDIFPREDVAAGERRLIGLKYAIIKSDIRSLAPAENGDGVLIVIGGGDSEDIGVDAARHLNEAGCDVTLIEGPFADTRTKLPAQIKRLFNPPRLAELMASCEWAVTSGGTTMMEMMCLGKPVHVLPRTGLETRLAEIVFEQGGVLGVGKDTLIAPSADARGKASQSARLLIDGVGVDRVADVIEQSA